MTERHTVRVHLARIGYNAENASAARRRNKEIKARRSTLKNQGGGSSSDWNHLPGTVISSRYTTGEYLRQMSIDAQRDTNDPSRAATLRDKQITADAKHGAITLIKRGVLTGAATLLAGTLIFDVASNGQSNNIPEEPKPSTTSTQLITSSNR